MTIDDINKALADELKMLKPESLLDVGCGIRPQKVYPVLTHVGVDAYYPYIAKMRQEHDLPCIWWDVSRGLPAPNSSYDIVWLGDVIEHLERWDGELLLYQALDVARKAVVVRTPLGFQEQHGDAWGLGGDRWQEHRSGWSREDMDFFAAGRNMSYWEAHNGPKGQPWFTALIHV